MVILETAAIGVAGYGVYRGGEESARKAKAAKKEYQREQKRRGQRGELAAKSRERSERLAQIAEMRSNRTHSSSSQYQQRSLSESSWPLDSSATSSSNNTTSDVEDRQKAVMAKLSNKPKPKSSKFSLFKKNKN
eukprot:scaffold11982_cov89-Cylindrotheca_fusiformis.AAC.1